MSVKLHTSRKTPAITSFPNWDVSFDRPNLTCKQKRGPTHQPFSGVARRLPPQLNFILADILSLSTDASFDGDLQVETP